MGPARLLERWGSPLNVLFPEIFAANVAGLRDELDASGLRYRICYAHKANQGRAFVRAALAAGIGIDVASPGELRSALAAGFPASRIEATGPKGRDFLARPDRLRGHRRHRRPGRARPARRARPRGRRRVPVLVGICRVSSGRPSRFGCRSPVSRRSPSWYAEAGDAVNLLGLSFHLDFVELSVRVQAIDECLRLFDGPGRPGSARGPGRGRQLPPGLHRRPGRSSSSRPGRRRRLAGHGGALTSGGAALGYRSRRRIRGALPRRVAGAAATKDMLGELIGGPLTGQGGRTVATVLREDVAELWIEPGKSLADHARPDPGQRGASGGSLRRQRAGGPERQPGQGLPGRPEVMVGPVLVYRRRAAASRAAAGVFFAGDLCLERDMIFTRLTFVDRLPEPGNVVAFIDAAAYQIDLSASAALMQRQRPSSPSAAPGPGAPRTPTQREHWHALSAHHPLIGTPAAAASTLHGTASRAPTCTQAGVPHRSAR